MSNLRMTFDRNEVQVLLIWLKQVSDTTYTDIPTRRAMNELKERFTYAIHAQMNGVPFQVDIATLGDFS